MIRRSISWFAAAGIAVAAFAWHQRDADPLGRLLRPEPPQRPIEFDNGTVRRYAAPAQPDVARPRTQLAPGTLRRCSRGTEVSYTDRACPSGFREGEVSRGTMNVLGGSSTPKPAAQEARPAPRSSLHDVLDTGAHDARLRERTIEQALR